MRPPDVVPFFDLSDPGFSVRSAAVQRARQTCWYARTTFGLAVLRHEQAAVLIRHPALRQGSAAWPAHHGVTTGEFARWWSTWVLNKEGDEHLRLRRALTPVFSRRVVDPLIPSFASLAGELADGFAAAGRCEFMADFAAPFAARAVCLLLGIGQEQWPAIAADAATVGLALGVNLSEHLARIETALAGLHRIADSVIADRLSEPRDDVVSTLVAAADGEPRLAGEELRDVLALLIFGGFDTTRNQLGLAMQLLAAHPGQWRLLGRHPELAPAAVEEVMRIRPTTTWVTRETAEDLTIDGLEIARGTTIHLLTESAGTDPMAFPDPAFDITATDRAPHFGFGGGIHYCLGHLVARADMSQALAVLARRIVDPRVLPDQVVMLPDSGNTGPARLPMTFQPGQPSGWRLKTGAEQAP